MIVVECDSCKDSRLCSMKAKASAIVLRCGLSLIRWIVTTARTMCRLGTEVLKGFIPPRAPLVRSKQ